MKKCLFIFVLIVIVIHSFGKSGSNDKQNNGRPNVVIIVSDDQYEFGFESKRNTTPHIDQLCEEGLHFTRAYTTAACTPTRYNIFSGKYASSCNSEVTMAHVFDDGTYGVQWIGSLDIRDEPFNLANTFQRGGYFTGHVGKLHNSIKSPVPEVNRARFSSIKAIKKDAPVDDRANNTYMRKHQRALQQTVKSLGFDYAASVVSANLDNLGWDKLVAHNMEWMTKGAVDFLEMAMDKEEPFFLFVATTLDHGPHGLRRSLDDDPRKTPGGYLDAPITGYQPSREDVIARAATIDDGRHGSTMWMDDGIGAIMQKLKDIGEDENTIIVFMTDHAVNGGKASCYEGGVSPPVIFRWKNHISPGESESLIHTIDYLPTFMNLCDLSHPKEETLEGKDISSILNDKTVTVRNSVLVEFGVSRAVVTQKYKYLAIRHPEYIITAEAHQKELEEFREYVKQNNLNANILLTDPQYADLQWPKDH